MTRQTEILIARASADYALLDSGEGEKLERFGPYTISRPDPQALWRKKLPAGEWKKADGRFAQKGSWSLKKGMPMRWPIALGGLKFYIKPTPFKHVGLFPEQLPNWEWMRKIIERAAGDDAKRGGRCEILNLFGYTGGASLAALSAGARVVHVDGSKTAISWARDNAELSGLADKPIRWILDDARALVRREAKRSRAYDAIIMDPPAFGHGPKGELWKIEEHLVPLIDDCLKILKKPPLFFLVNGYAAGYSALAYENVLQPLAGLFGGKTEFGELAIEEQALHASGRLLPCGIFARWPSL
ncbi:MAG: rRNA (cytosine1962-C5)-methyltransferase [Candidatus Parcubacteria bacterium]|jgi:23S rRNA (cytosine1962-C5)-methyltransferase|nr:rRNA (cytosine1962-C5)-methyltransferase [Candidatus Parcubacteria bacterium]